MPDFRQDINPSNDPNYLRQSREPDRIKPLEQVPIPANTIADTSMGSLFAGIADFSGNVLSAADQTIKRNILDDAHNAVDALQTNYGVGMSSDEVVPIAGTGAKGRARVAAAQQNNLFGSADGGAGSNSYAPEGSDTTYGGLPPEITGQGLRPLPPGADKELATVSRMNDAYLQGGLSDSHYNAQLLATTKELRARYPGYRDEVDQAISQITGVQPANALRKSLLSDLNANAAARASAASGQDREIMKEMPYISIFAPDFRENPGKYKGQEAALLQKAYNFQARQKAIAASEASATFDSHNAESTFTDKTNLLVQTGITAFNSAADSEGKTLNMRYNEYLQNPASFTPEARANLIGALQQIRTQTLQATQSAATAPLPSGKSYSSVINDPAKLTAIQNQALMPLDQMIQAVQNNDLSTAKIINDTLQINMNKEALRISQANPLAKALGGLSQLGVKELSGIITNTHPKEVSNMMNVILSSKAAEVIQPGPNGVPDIKAQADDAAKAGPINGKTLGALIDQNFQMFQNDKLGPQVNMNAAKNIFSTDMLSSLSSSKDRLAFFNRVAAPETTARVYEMGKTDGTVWNQYQRFVNFAAADVYKTAGDTVQSYVTDKRFDVKYDPDTHQLIGTMKPEFRGVDTVSRNQEAAFQQSLAPINRALSLLSPMYEKNKQDVNGQILNFLGSVGVNPNAPKDTNSVASYLTNAVKKGWDGATEWIGKQGIQQNTLENDPFNPANRRGNYSTSTGATPLHNVIGQAEAGGDYNAVFGMGKRNSLNLADMTVGEVMALQKHNTDNGQASSAVGKYQFLRKTLASLVKEGAVSTDDQFTPDLQDTLATRLMERRGLKEYQAGKLSKGQFLQNLSQEWAGLPSNNGMSYYEGDGLNHATVGLPKVLASLADIGPGSVSRFAGAGAGGFSDDNPEPYNFAPGRPIYDQFNKSPNVEDRRDENLRDIMARERPTRPRLTDDQTFDLNETAKSIDPKLMELGRALGIKDVQGFSELAKKLGIGDITKK